MAPLPPLRPRGAAAAAPLAALFLPSSAAMAAKRAPRGLGLRPAAGGGVAAATAMGSASAGTKTSGLPNMSRSLFVCTMRSLRSFSRCFWPTVSILNGRFLCAFSTSALRSFSTSSVPRRSSSPTFRKPGGACGDGGRAARRFSSAISSCRLRRYAGTLPTSFRSTGGGVPPSRGRGAELDAARAFTRGPPASAPEGEAASPGSLWALRLGGSLGARGRLSSLRFPGAAPALPARLPLPGAALGSGGRAAQGVRPGLAGPRGVPASATIEATEPAGDGGGSFSIPFGRAVAQLRQRPCYDHTNPVSASARE
mmetsp:Transcript_148303/g.413062  ORF Transcript_148303/g.413062 Transcript_148303/m.413062 type:complete len:311 (+) Transcript_148303:391-1323(+)